MVYLYPRMHRYAKNGKVPVSNTVRVGYGNKYYTYPAKIFIFLFFLLWVQLAQGGNMVLVEKKKKEKRKEKKGILARK